MSEVVFMIVFDGLISGSAEKYFFKKLHYYSCLAFYIGMLVFLPLFIVAGILIKSWILIGFYLLTILVVPVFLSLPKSKKEKKLILPQKIVVQNDTILCITEKNTEKKYIGTVKKVNKFDDFYEVVFPIGNVSEKFICQKSLLVKGTIEDFEKIFTNKIIDRTKTNDQSDQSE